MVANSDKQSSSNTKLIKALAENSLALQKKNIEMIQSMSELTKKVSRLVGIFEEASKHVMEVGEEKRILEIADKLEKLLEQNQTIAGGLLMLEKYVKERSSPSMLRPMR